MVICRKQKWTLNQWMKLTPIEQEYWIAFEQHQRKRLMHWYDKLAEEEKNTPDVVTLIRMAIDGDF